MAEVKTMAQKSTEVNPTIQVSKDFSETMVPGNFHEFQGSQAKMYSTYSNRMSKIAAALGNKAPLVS
jgi:hypothetical protein